MSSAGLGSGKEIAFTASERVDVKRRWIRPFTSGRAFVCTYRADTAPKGEAYAQTGIEAYLAVVYLRPFGAHNERCNGEVVEVGPTAIGGLRLYDLRQSWSSDLPHPFHMLGIFIPRQLFEEVGVDYRLPTDSLPWAPGTVLVDPVIGQLTEVLRPLVDSDDDRLFADQILNAMTVHLVGTYGGAKPKWRTTQSGLAPWQLRRVTDLMVGQLGHNFTLDELGQACGLSPQHFGRMFRASVGLPPFRWLHEQRIEYARKLLEKSDMDLSEIALTCGFANQSHFTRCFSRSTGVSPGLWRRLRKTQ